MYADPRKSPDESDTGQAMSHDETLHDNTADELIADRTQVRAWLDRIPLSSSDEKAQQLAYKSRVKELLVARNAVVVAHYYTDPALQELAEETGGFVADSLEMARFGTRTSADILVVAVCASWGDSKDSQSREDRPDANSRGHLFTGYWLSGRTIFGFLCPVPGSRDRGVCQHFRGGQGHGRLGSNSAIAVDVVEHLLDQGKKVIWAPDKHLGRYIRNSLKAGDDEFVIWDGACIVHEEFKTRALLDMKQLYPDAAVLAHPESPLSVLELADVVGSTSQIINAAKERPERIFIVATDQGIFYKLQQQAPDKEFIMAPTSGRSHLPQLCKLSLDGHEQHEESA